MQARASGTLGSCLEPRAAAEGRQSRDMRGAVFVAVKDSSPFPVLPCRWCGLCVYPQGLLGAHLCEFHGPYLPNGNNTDYLTRLPQEFKETVPMKRSSQCVIQIALNPYKHTNVCIHMHMHTHTATSFFLPAGPSLFVHFHLTLSNTPWILFLPLLPLLSSCAPFPMSSLHLAACSGLFMKSSHVASAQ